MPIMKSRSSFFFYIKKTPCLTTSYFDHASANDIVRILFCFLWPGSEMKGGNNEAREHDNFMAFPFPLFVFFLHLSRFFYFCDASASGSQNLFRHDIYIPVCGFSLSWAQLAWLPPSPLNTRVTSLSLSMYLMHTRWAFIIFFVSGDRVERRCGPCLDLLFFFLFPSLLSYPTLHVYVSIVHYFPLSRFSAFL
jgi:hypothetical protein